MAKKVTEAAGIRSEAVEAKTGKSWDQWFILLDKAGAKEWPHKEIAKYLQSECGCPPWWGQMVTVGYEQERGLRVKHQLCSGEFSTSASKTFAVPVAELFACWKDAKARAKWLPDSGKITVRKATVNKSMRITWHDDTLVEINFWDKGPAKSQAAVQHRKLEGPKEVAQLKQYWADAMSKLQRLLEGPIKKKPAGIAAPRRAAST
jgi:hypothetical protein